MVQPLSGLLISIYFHAAINVLELLKRGKIAGTAFATACMAYRDETFI